MKHQILLVDDDEQLSDILVLVLESEGYVVHSTATPQAALEKLMQSSYSLVLLDLKLADHNGLELLPKIREAEPDVPVLMISAHGDLESAVESFKLGANGFIRKPFQEGHLKEQINQAVEAFDLKRQVHLMGHLLPEDDVRSMIQSRDPSMNVVLRRVAVAAQVGSNVVIEGESGTGKELVAKALHFCGPRRAGPFVAFNCAAIPENLLESELFGYQRGAFTDAKENKPGLFQRAHGGTLFLDEIGDAPLSFQSKLLRVLQEREVMPLGSTQPIKVDVRVVGATHQNLQHEVSAGRFRQDLYYRLHVLPIHVPSLRARPKDILLLASLFAKRLASEMNRPFDGFTSAAEAELSSHGWPGNVRELQNRVEHALAISLSRKLTAKDLFPERPEPAESEEIVSLGEAELPTFGEAKNSFEKSYLEKLLGAAQGNIAKAARLASKSRTEVYSLIRKHSLDPSRFKQAGAPEDVVHGSE